MNILKYTSLISNLSDNLLKIINDNNIFWQDNYAKYATIGGGKVIYLYDDNDDLAIAVAIKHKYCFKYAYFVSEPISVNRLEDTKIKKFLDNCILTLKKVFRVQWINPVSATLNFTTYPSKSKRIPFGSHVIDLNNDEETLWKNMHSKHRNSIRRADKGNVKIKFGSRELLYDYLILDYDTWERSDKKGNSIEYYENIFNYLADNAVVVIGYKDSVPQGGAIFIFNKEGAYYMYGASKNNPEPGTMNLLHWKAMLYMKDRGVKKYNFVGCRINVDEGSKYQGIQRFKEHFGGDLQMGYMFKVVINKTMYSLFQKSIQTVNKTKYNDAIDQEIHKWIELNREE